MRDDGAEQSRRFEIAATLGERRLAAGIGADEFAGMGWVTRELGSAAVIYAGQTKRDHVRAAIQLLSRSVAARTSMRIWAGVRSKARRSTCMPAVRSVRSVSLMA